MHTWRRRKEALSVFSRYAKRHKSVYIFVNNNTNFNFLKILSNYTIWDRLSQKTISRYCPFKAVSSRRENLKHIFTVPETVAKTLECIEEGKLLQVRTSAGWEEASLVNL